MKLQLPLLSQLFRSVSHYFSLVQQLTKMSYGQKNKFITRFSTLNTPPAPRKHKEQNKQLLTIKSSQFYANTSNQSMSRNVQVSEGDRQLIDRLQKHIVYLQRKLSELQEQQTLHNRCLGTMRQKIQEKDGQIQYLGKKIEEYEYQTKFYKFKCEALQSDLQNLKLQQKMERISRDIEEEKVQKSKVDIKHQMHRKGKFSAAFLPAEFDSPSKNKSHKASKFTLANIQDGDQVKQSQMLLRNPMSGYLIDEWQRSKEQKQAKQKELSVTEAKLTNLRRQIVKQQKQMVKMKTTAVQKEKQERTLIIELSKAKQKLKQNMKQKKILISKLQDGQSKINELTGILKQRGQLSGQDRFYGNYSIEGINQLIEKMSYSLQIDSSTVDISLQPPNKKSDDVQVQTSVQSNPQVSEKNKVHSLQMLIMQLTEQMIHKQHQFKAKLQQESNKYEETIKDYLLDLEEYRYKIEEYNLTISQYQKQKYCQWEKKQGEFFSNNLVKKDVAISCAIIPNDIFQERVQILDKVKMLMEFNQEQQNQISKFKKEMTRLNQMKKCFDVEDKATNVSEQEWQECCNQQKTENHQSCSQCDSNRQKLIKVGQQMLKLTKQLLAMKEDKNHYEQCYNETLTNYHRSEAQGLIEINKLKEQLSDKQKTVLNLSIELQQKIHELAQCETRLKECESQLQSCKLKLQLFQQLQ